MAMTKEQQQAIAAARARLRLQEQDNGIGGFLPFANQRLAGVIGAPVDITNSLLKAVGMPVSDTPFGGSKSIQSGMNKIGIPTPNRDPRTVRENIGAAAGEAAGSLIPLAAFARKANAGKGVVGNMARAFNREMVNAPVRSAGIEAAAAAGVGTARHAAEQGNMSPGGQMLAETAGGVLGAATGTGAMALARNSPSLVTLRGIKRMVFPFTEAGGFERASTRIQELIQDPNRAIASIEDLKGTNLRPSAASGEPGLMALEQAVLRDRPELADDFSAQTSEAVKGLVDSIKKSGSTKTTQQFIRAKRDRLFSALDARIDKASQEAVQAAGRARADVPPEQFSILVRERIESALADAKAQEAMLWQAVPQDAIIPVKNLKSKYLQLLETLPQAQKSDMPSDAVAIEGMGNSNVLMELDGLYKRLGEVGRAARSADQFNKARITDELRDAILEDMANAPDSSIKESIETARRFSRQVADRFRKGPVGKILGYDIKGGASVADELTLPKTAGRPGVYGKLGVDAVAKATDYDVEALAGVQDYLKAQFTKAAIEEGAVNPQKAQTWLKNNREALDAFPHLKSQFETARTTEDVARRVKTRAESLRRKFQRPEVSATARFLNADVGKEIESVLSAPDPGTTMKRLMAGASRNQEAADGMKAGLSEWLINQSVQGATVDAFGAPVINGAKMKLMLKSDRVRPALEAVFSADELKDMERAAEALSLVGRQKQARAGNLQISNDAPGSIISIIARVAGAKLGAMLSGNPGASIQAAQIGSSRMQKLLNSLTADKATQVIVDAMRDPELMKALVNHSARDRRAKFRHERVIRGWMGSVGSRLLEEEED